MPKISYTPEQIINKLREAEIMLSRGLPSDGRKILGTYVYGKAEPLKEEMELSFRRLMNWIDLCGLKLEYAHTSGHMYQRDVERFVSEVNAKTVVPIHTEHPELFTEWAKNVRIPKLGETLHL